MKAEMGMSVIPGWEWYITKLSREGTIGNKGG
jgi:hypothetical protein